MDYYNGSYQSNIAQSMQLLYNKVISFLPNLLVAIIVLLLGWLIAEFLGRLFRSLLDLIKIDHLANRLGLNHLSQRVGRKLSIAKLGQWLVKWFFIVASFLAAANILGLNQVGDFLYTKVLPYFGHVVVAVAILLIGTYAANFLGDLVHGTLAAGELRTPNALSSVTRWSVMIFAILAALAQLQVAPAFLATLFTGIVAMLAIAGGLAFGLGGTEHAKKVIEKISQQLK